MSSREQPARVLNQFSRQVDIAGREIREMHKMIRELEQMLAQYDQADWLRSDPRFRSEVMRCNREVMELEQNLKNLMRELGDTRLKLKRVVS